MTKYPVLCTLAFSTLATSLTATDLQLSDPSAISNAISQSLSDTNQALAALNNGKLEWLGENSDTEVSAIAAPNLGDLLYNSTVGEFQIFDGTNWGPVGETNSAAETVALIDAHFGSSDWRTQDGFQINTDAQALGLDGTALSISNGNTVDLSSLSISPTLSGDPTAPDAPISDEDGSIANTKYVAEKIDSEIAAISSISLAYNSSLANDGDYSGIPHSGGTAGEAILEGDVVYRNFSDGLLYLADADDGTETSPKRRPVGIAIEEAASGSDVTFLDRGYLRTDIWQWQDGPIFLDTVAGGTTQIQPSESVLPLGYAITPDTMFVQVDYNSNILAIDVPSSNELTIILQENFEGSGVPAGWSSNGSVDWDFDSNALEGAESATINNNSSSSSSFLEYSFEDATIVKVSGIAQYSSVGASPTVIELYNDTNRLLRVRFNSDGGLGLRDGSNQTLESSSSGVISQGSPYYYWVYFDSATGELTAKASSTSTEPVTPNVTTTHTAASPNKIRFRTENYARGIFDQVQIETN